MQNECRRFCVCCIYFICGTEKTQDFVIIPTASSVNVLISGDGMSHWQPLIFGVCPLSIAVSRNRSLHKGHLKISKHCIGHKPVVNSESLSFQRNFIFIK